jgi:hypothetical protein
MFCPDVAARSVASTSTAVAPPTSSKVMCTAPTPGPDVEQRGSGDPFAADDFGQLLRGGMWTTIAPLCEVALGTKAVVAEEHEIIVTTDPAKRARAMAWTDGAPLSQEEPAARWRRAQRTLTPMG